MSDEEEDVPIETLLMTTAYLLVQDRDKRLIDLDEEFLLDLKLKINDCYKEKIGTLH